MNNENNTEIEIKLTTVSRQALDGIFFLSLILDVMVAGSEKKSNLESRYYDTPNRKFAKAGIVFRVRKEPDGYVGTVKAEKLNNGGLSERLEYNVALPDEKPSFEGFDEINFLFNVKELVEKNGGVEELFRVSVQRHQCDLVLSGATVVEMAVDIGEIVAGEKSLPVCEVEFELKQGNQLDLFNFIARLSEKVPLFAEQRSKYSRGAELAGEKIKVNKATAVEQITASKACKKDWQAALSRQAGYASTCVKDCLDSEQHLDRLYESLQQLELLLVFTQELFAETGWLEQKKKLEKTLAQLEQYFLVADFCLLWQKINEKTAPIHTTALLQKLLQEKSSFYQEKVRQQLVDGHYTTQLFSLIAWLEGGDWRNNVEPSGKAYLEERLEQLQSQAVQLYKQDDRQKLCLVLETICHSVKLCRKFSGKGEKSIAKTAKALLGQMQRKALEEKLGKSLFSLFRASAGRLLYRDAGILLGYYFKSCKYKQQKIDQKFAEFQKAKKGAALETGQPELEIIDLD